MRFRCEGHDVIDVLHQVLGEMGITNIAVDKPITLVAFYVAKVRRVSCVRQLI